MATTPRSDQDYADLLAKLREDVAGGEYSGGGYRYVEVMPDTASEAIAAIEALVKERDEQGPCWDEGMTLPVREGECAPMPPKCELPHGHGGAHRAGRREWMRRDSYNSVVAERDELKREMHARELHHFEEEQKSAGLAAVVEKVREACDTWWPVGGEYGDVFVVDRDDVLNALSTAPATALAEHDRQVAERAWDEGVELALNFAKRNPDGVTLRLEKPNPYRKEQENNHA